MSGQLLSDLGTIEDLAWRLARSGLETLEAVSGTTRLSLSVTSMELAGPASVTPDPIEGAPPCIVVSPGTGRLTFSHPALQNAPPLPEALVSIGQIVAYVAVGAVFLPVVSPSEGRMEALLTVEGAPVGFGSPILSLRIATSTGP